jgi:uncharacterized protein (TIGR02391 family)
MKRWDDVQILRLIDELEGSEPAALMSGFTLMQRARPGAELDHQRDPGPFANELLLARESGLLTFDDRVYGQRAADSHTEAYMWLQQIREIALTIPGRDRARGRELVTPLPNPDEDDGRMITGLTLEEIALSIADTFTPSQLPTFLVDSGMPEGVVPTVVDEDKPAYVMSVLSYLHDGGSEARRSLRAFIGAWLSDQLHASPSDEKRRRIVDHLGRQGWHVKGGMLVIGERTTVDSGALTPLGRDYRIGNLHASIRQVAERYLDRGTPEVAIFEAFKAINNRVKEVTGLDADGQDLMAKAIGDANPLIQFGDLTTDTGRNVQAGFRFMFMGAVRGIRNRDAHQQFRPLNEEEAFEELSLASMLMRRLDAALIANRRGGTAN